jgi:hypothetical protein
MTDELTGPDGLPLVQEFPKMLYHIDGFRKIVATQDEQDAAGADWHEAPVPPPEVEPPASEDAEPA